MIPDPSKLLVVDDELNRGGDALSLRLAGQGYVVEVAQNSLEALERIRTARYDLVVLGQMAPALSGGTTQLDLLRLLRATHSPSELPVIVVAAAGDAAQDLQDGASDYLSEPLNPPDVAARIATQLSRAKTDQHVRFLDPLTRLGNRAALLAQLHDLLAPCRSGRRGTAALVRLDLDGFQRLNNSLGDSAGDDLLRIAARRVQHAVRSVRWAGHFGVARIGGDEFAVAGPCEDRRRLEELAVAILQHLNRALVVQGARLPLRASMGIAAAGREKVSAEGLLRDAHHAMERARQRGGNRSEFFDTALREHAQNRMTLALELQDALDQNRLTVLYQPKIRLQERRMDGFEALLRWRRAGGQAVPPAEFIPIAEETGLIQKIGLWVLKQACVQLAGWQKQFPSEWPLSMNVNVSVKQLAALDFVEQVRHILDETGIAPETLKLELTESTLMAEVESAREVLANLRSLRVGLKLDDFGNGYSSLGYLRALHFDSLKVSRSFVSKVGTDRKTRTIVESVIRLAHALNMSVVAEGIETEKQLHALESMGCDLGQGFLFHKPLDRASVETLLKNGRGVSFAQSAPAQMPAPRSAAAPVQ